MAKELIFVSYSSADRPFAIGLAKELQKLGANIWIDQLGIQLGENWDSAIEKALDSSNTFMLLLSPTSVESQNVQDEASIAIQEDKRMVPILIKPCDLPMRWKRRQYADLTSNPDKAITDVLNFLGLKEKAADNLKELLNLINVDSAPKDSPSDDDSELDHVDTEDINKVDLLISEEEIDGAIKMHKKATKKNGQLIILAAVVSLVLIAVALFTELLPIPKWMAVVAGLALNFISILPFGDNKKRARKIDLFELMKLNRQRLIRVVNKLSDKDIHDFNSKFEENLTI